MSDTHSDSEDGEQAALVQILNTVHLKVAGTLYALSGGKAMVGVNRAAVTPVLEALGVGNVPSALQPARIEAQGGGAYKHNGGSGASARLAITERGVALVKRLFTSEAGQVQEDVLAGMVSVIKRLGQADQDKQAEAGEAGEASEEDDGPPSSKRARRSASATAGGATSTPQSPGAATAVAEAAVKAIADSDEEGANAPSALEKRLKALLAQHDAAIDQDALGELYGKETANFYQTHKRAPTTEEAANLLRGAKCEQSAVTTVGDGVSRAQIATLLRKLREAQKLHEMVKALEVRAAAA